MTSPNPFTAINVHGGGITRGVTLALTSDWARDLLPAGLELGKQDVTDDGYHPVILFFHDVFQAQTSIPSLVPGMNYHEHSIGIPFAYLSRNSITPGYPGPYHFMPKLYLDNPLAAAAGVLLWGFAKEMASILVTAERFTINGFDGRRLTALSWNTGGGGVHRPVGDWPYFKPVRRMLEQPLISMVPAAMGPFFIRSDFDRNWQVATVRPLQTALDVDVEYAPGYPGGRYPVSGWSPGIDSSVLGSYELRAPWRLSVPYHPLLSFRR